MKFVDLPAEIIQHIASFLPLKSLLSLSQTCKLLNDIGKIDSLWAALSYQDYQITSNKGWNLSYKDIYTKVLCKLHGIFGIKRVAIVPYGGLVNVCWADGEIQVNRYMSKPGDKAFSDLTCQQLFSLRWNQSKESIDVFCVQCPSNPQPAKLAQAGKYPLLQCADVDCLMAHTLKEYCYGQSDKNIDSNFDGLQDNFQLFNLDRGFNCPLLPMPKSTPADQARSPIELGLYKGDYGSHGVEIVNLMINQSDPLKLEGLKIVGDSNVPAGVVSIIVSLDKPIFLTQEEQVTISSMLDVDCERTDDSFVSLFDAIKSNPENLHQPFVVPEDCFEIDLQPPNTCIGRYLGNGTIAGFLYDGPTFCKCHFIQFSNDKFGVMWLELNSFSMFYKVTEDLPLCLSKPQLPNGHMRTIRK